MLCIRGFSAATGYGMRGDNWQANEIRLHASVNIVQFNWPAGHHIHHFAIGPAKFLQGRIGKVSCRYFPRSMGINNNDAVRETTVRWVAAHMTEAGLENVEYFPDSRAPHYWVVQAGFTCSPSKAFCGVAVAAAEKFVGALRFTESEKGDFFRQLVFPRYTYIRHRERWMEYGDYVLESQGLIKAESGGVRVFKEGEEYSLH
ncbi:MAG: hypothetical protein P4L67_05625 [Candidatus Pacebacteria bacterium]|nr:hypothetical protein [Candidatus Paceibacterota bacterium]